MSELAIRSTGLAALFARPAVAAPAPSAPPDLEALRGDAFDAGFAAGARAAEGDLSPVRLRLAAAAGALEAACSIDMQALHAPFTALVTRLAEAVVAAELRLSPDSIGRLVSAALAAISVDPALSLRLHPDDAALLAGETLPLPVIADPQIAPGSALVEAPRFVIADSFAARLQTLLEALP